MLDNLGIAEVVLSHLLVSLRGSRGRDPVISSLGKASIEMERRSPSF